MVRSFSHVRGHASAISNFLVKIYLENEYQAFLGMSNIVDYFFKEIKVADQYSSFKRACYQDYYRMRHMTGIVFRCVPCIVQEIILKILLSLMVGNLRPKDSE